jgi:hypothetical protein
MQNSKNIGTIRTGLPAAWATFVTWIVAKFGLNLDEADYSMMMLVLPVVIPVFYRISREIEQNYPKIGKIIFGSGSSPVYEESAS